LLIFLMKDDILPSCCEDRRYCALQGLRAEPPYLYFLDPPLSHLRKQSESPKMNIVILPAPDSLPICRVSVSVSSSDAS
jgi:hypothetical protein